MENSESARFLMHDTQTLAFQDQILDAQNYEADELPQIFSAFWHDWYNLSQQHNHDVTVLLRLLEELLFRSSDELLTHELAVQLCRALRFWQLQVQRQEAGGLPAPENRGNTGDAGAGKVRLWALIETWDLFQQNFISRQSQYKSILLKALAVPYSFAGLAIIKTVDKEVLQKQSSLSLYSSISTQIRSRSGGADSAMDHSWTIDLLSAKFQKTVGFLTQAEKLLQNLCKNLQTGIHSTIYSSALFELCDIYRQMEQEQWFCASIRKLLLQNPISWDFALVGSQFCSQLLEKLPHPVRSQFHSNDPVALNWSGLYALADGDYGPGCSLSHQQQKSYWAQILQLKKALSEQKFISKQNASHQQQSVSRQISGLDTETQAHSRFGQDRMTGGEFYSLQRARLLIYYILILEHLDWIRQVENSPQVLAENSTLWQNVMIEIYSLSEDISQRCKNRFARNT